MIYSKVDNPKCRICVYAEKINDSGNAKCTIKGVVPEDYCCKKFKYDIFKKTIRPQKSIDKNRYKKEDFIL